MRRLSPVVLACLGLWLGFSAFAVGAQGRHSINDVSIELPDAETLVRVLTLRDYNTRVVLAGVTLLGAAGGLVGTFLLLRKRSLLSDSLSHACLPGICLAFIAGELAFGAGKSLPLLLAGATLSGLAGIAAIAGLRRIPKIKDDAALALVLSIFFGLGIALISLVQQLPSGNAAGLKGFIFGKAASMTLGDATLIGWLATLVLAAVIALRRELTLLCFDEAFAKSSGLPTFVLDLVLMGLVVAATVIGLQAVGLLLVVALLIIPPTAARFWSDRIFPNLGISAAFGALSGAVGVLASALLPKFPAGAVIVLAALVLFSISFLFGPAKGVVRRWLDHRGLTGRIENQHLLRAFFEVLETRSVDSEAEATQSASGEVMLQELEAKRAWKSGRIKKLLARAERAGALVSLENDRYQLTAHGWNEARRITRNHRLWELYLIHYAATAPAIVDREADAVEHVVGRDVVDRLERLLEETTHAQMPGSPHALR
jgi:manganese/zinc/iron transport system permease protein